MKIENRKALVFFVAVLLAVSFVALVFHHHDDGLPHSDCAVCRFVQYLLSTLIPVSAFVTVTVSERFFVSAPKIFSSLLLTPNLQGRAPPTLS